MSTDVGGDATALRERLERSRAELLDAIGRLTEAGFQREVEAGRSVLGVLGELGRTERQAIAGARQAAGLPPRRGTGASSPSELPPQVIHDLAGARHETMRLLDELDARSLAASAAALEGIATRETEAAARIRASQVAE